MSKLNETAEQVAALIPRFSWQLMDEDQRDELMVNVVLPRYMQTTADGTNLGPTWWAEAVGASSGAVQKRIERLRKAAETANGATTRAEPNSRTGRAAATLRDPDKAAAVLRDPEVRASVLKALDEEHEARVRKSEHKPETVRDENVHSVSLIVRLRAAHRAMADVVELAQDIRGIAADELREAVRHEIDWIRGACDVVETGLDGGSLDEQLRDLLEAEAGR